MKKIHILYFIALISFGVLNGMEEKSLSDENSDDSKTDNVLMEKILAWADMKISRTTEKSQKDGDSNKRECPNVKNFYVDLTKEEDEVDDNPDFGTQQNKFNFVGNTKKKENVAQKRKRKSYEKNK